MQVFFSITSNFLYTKGSHPHTPTPYAHSPTPKPHYGALGYRPPPYGYTSRPAPYSPPRPHYPTSAAPGYHGHALAVTPKPHGGGYAPHGHHEPHGGHGSDYGPPSCVKNATLHTYCLEDPEYPAYEIQVKIYIKLQ